MTNMERLQINIILFSNHFFHLFTTNSNGELKIWIFYNVLWQYLVMKNRSQFSFHFLSCVSNPPQEFFDIFPFGEIRFRSVWVFFLMRFYQLLTRRDFAASKIFPLYLSILSQSPPQWWLRSHLIGRYRLDIFHSAPHWPKITHSEKYFQNKKRTRGVREKYYNLINKIIQNYKCCRELLRELFQKMCGKCLNETYRLLMTKKLKNSDIWRTLANESFFNWTKENAYGHIS